MLEPERHEPRERLLLVAADRQRGTIRTFGIGLPSRSTATPAQARLLAREAALTDAQAWVARVAMWLEEGVAGPLDVSWTVVGIETLSAIWLEEEVCLVEVVAPLEQDTTGGSPSD